MVCRIEERFPGSGLGRLCDALLKVSRAAKARSTEMARPLVGLRILASVVGLVLLGAFIETLIHFYRPLDNFEFLQFLQGLDAGVDMVVLLGVSVLFLVTLETRVKRGRAMKALHELRTLAHLIDIHQLTKDPAVLLTPTMATRSSPRRSLSLFELGRYLSYCSEMLSLTGKLAALYAQNFNDPVVLAAVNEIEGLTTALSSKIWQKIAVLQRDPAHA